MRTEWGLDLDMSAVRLMSWTGETWDELQSEAIDSPDIEDRLNAMLARIDTGAEVTLFLPLDQILCTEIEVSGGDDVKAEIERAMDGRTPYTLDELILDWELEGNGQAKVVAIARDTLDEAAAFAEVRGVGVAYYSSLGLGDSFPRLPRFEGPRIPASSSNKLAAEPEPEPEPQSDEAVFATARKPSRPPVDTSDETADKTAAAKDTLVLKPEQGASIEAPATPVVQVDDATPVMLVKGPKMALNPGTPIAPGRVVRPRVRTDIAAGTMSGSAASLAPKVTPGGSVQIHRRRSPVAMTALVFAAVFVLTIGIATLVWSLLPFSPNRETLPERAETGLVEQGEVLSSDVAAGPEFAEDEAPVAEDVVAETDPLQQPSEDLAALPEPAPPAEDQVLAEAVEPAEPEVPDLPQPTISLVVARLDAPVSGALPQTGVQQDAAPQSRIALLASLEPEAAQHPAYDPAPPLAVTPEAFANILATAPRIGTAPKDEAQLDDISVAANESSELAADAIALPSVFGLVAEALPQVDVDAPANDDTTVAALTPDTPSVFEEDTSIEETLATPELPTVDEPEVASLTPEVEETPVEEGLDGALAAAVEQALSDALVGPGGLIQTEHAAALPDTGPRARPQRFVETIEREQFGGRTREELATLRPPARPAAEQAVAPAGPPSALAVTRSANPRLRPENFSALVAQARVQREAERLSASVNTRTPDTSSAVQAALEAEPQQPVREARQPNIPTSASVARQATVDNAIRLNRVNLVGVYGIASDRRALVRLPSGRYVKVKVGDRVDGGTVAQITDRELIYRKGSRTLSLAIPQS